jgi:Spy/CpxP family protein refolding chaperone
MTTTRVTRAIATVAIGLVCTLGAGVAVAQMAKSAWGGGRIERAYQRILGRLNLSADQKSQIDALLAAEKPTIANLAQQLKGDAATLRAAATAAQPDPAAVGNAFLKVKADGQALRAELQKVRQGTEAVLSPEQKGTFDAYLDASRAMHRRLRPANG